MFPWKSQHDETTLSEIIKQIDAVKIPIDTEKEIGLLCNGKLGHKLSEAYCKLLLEQISRDLANLTNNQVDSEVCRVLKLILATSYFVAPDTSLNMLMTYFKTINLTIIEDGCYTSIISILELLFQNIFEEACKQWTTSFKSVVYSMNSSTYLFHDLLFAIQQIFVHVLKFKPSLAKSNIITSIQSLLGVLIMQNSTIAYECITRNDFIKTTQAFADKLLDGAVLTRSFTMEFTFWHLVDLMCDAFVSSTDFLVLAPRLSKWISLIYEEENSDERFSISESLYNTRTKVILESLNLMDFWNGMEFKSPSARMVHLFQYYSERLKKHSLDYLAFFDNVLLELGSISPCLFIILHHCLQREFEIWNRYILHKSELFSLILNGLVNEYTSALSFIIMFQVFPECNYEQPLKLTANFMANQKMEIQAVSTVLFAHFFSFLNQTKVSDDFFTESLLEKYTQEIIRNEFLWLIFIKSLRELDHVICSRVMFGMQVGLIQTLKYIQDESFTEICIEQFYLALELPRKSLLLTEFFFEFGEMISRAVGNNLQSCNKLCKILELLLSDGNKNSLSLELGASGFCKTILDITRSPCFREQIPVNYDMLLCPFKVFSIVLKYDNLLADTLVDIDTFKLILELYVFVTWDDLFSCFENILYTNSNGMNFVFHQCAVKSLLEIYPEMDLNCKLRLLRTFHDICIPSNYQVMLQFMSCNLTTWLIKCLLSATEEEPFQEIMELLSILLAFNTNLSDLKLILTGLKADENKLPWNHDMLLRSLLMATEKMTLFAEEDLFVPICTKWNFEMPNIENWNENRGYTFFISFKGEWNMEDSFIICDLNFCTYVIRFIVSKSKLTLRLKRDEHEDLIIETCIVSPNTWYSLAFIHQMGLFNSTTACIIVDGAQLWQGTMPYPPSKSIMKIVCSSSSTVVDCKPFPGYFSSIAFFDMPLTVDYIQTLHIIKEVSLPISSILYHFQLLSPTQQPILFLHPKGSNGNQECFSISGNPRALNLAPSKLSNLVPISKFPIPKTLECLGGLKILYPLQGQVHFPIAACPFKNFITDESTRAALPIRLICRLVAHSSLNRAYFMESKGPMLISLLLQNNHNTSTNLVCMIDKAILFEPQIWSLANIDIQKIYFEKIHIMIENSKDISISYGFEYWLESFEQFLTHSQNVDHIWDFLRFLSSSNYDINADILFESLVFHVNNATLAPLYNLYESLHTENTTLFIKVFEIGGPNLLLRILQSIHEEIRDCGIRLMELILLEKDPRFSKMKTTLLDSVPLVFSDVLKGFKYSLLIYSTLLNLSFERKLNQRELCESDDLAIKQPLFLKCAFDLLAVNTLIDEIVEHRIHQDISCMLLLTENINHIRNITSIYSIVQYINKRPERKFLEQLIKNFAKFCSGLISKDPSSVSIIQDIMISFVLLIRYPNPAELLGEFLGEMLRLITSIKSDEVEEKQIITIFQEISNYLFYFKVISAAFKDTFGESMYNADDLIRNIQNISKDLNVTYQVSLPFEENEKLSVVYLEALYALIISKEPKANNGHVFYLPFVSDRKVLESLLTMFTSLVLSSLETYNESIWNASLSKMDFVLDLQFLKVDFPKDFILYVIGSLVDAWKKHPFELLDTCISKSLKLWTSKLRFAKNIDFESSLSLILETNDWEVFSNQHLFTAMKANDNQVIAESQQITKKYFSAAKHWISKLGKELENSTRKMKFVVDKVELIAGNIVEKRKNRISDKIKASEIENHKVTRLWHRQAQEVSYTKHIWANEKHPNYFKLDVHENSNRMRRKLVRNFEYNDHTDASEKRDKIPLSQRKKIEELRHAYSLQDRQNILVERLQRLQTLTREASSKLNEDILDSFEILQDDVNSNTEADISVEAEMILYTTTAKGRFEITSTDIIFTPETTNGLPLATSISPTLANVKGAILQAEEYQWPLKELKRIFLRRHKLSSSALEFFFDDGRAYFFKFEHSSDKSDKKQSSERNRVLKKIISLKPPKLLPVHFGTPRESLESANITQRWVNGEISNFDYLIWLNTYSGRSYNDLTRYPVFPWVLSDFSKESIDLNDETVYRDLKKPMGALNEARLSYFQNRAEAFEDPTGQIQKFLYGSHYSSAAGVLYYLLRLEPFTSLHISLQGGKFDHADRQFHSFESLWNSVTTSTSDVKELIPEFYYFSEFLENHNKFDLGATQAGYCLNDVVLPKWASSPEEFILIHRLALESDYVSKNLNHWIDLIWGYKQTGPEALKANNLFYYLTYENEVNLEDVNDPLEKKSIEDQINHFGQTPSQLFIKPHPEKQLNPKEKLPITIKSFNLNSDSKCKWFFTTCIQESDIFTVKNLKRDNRIFGVGSNLDFHSYKISEDCSVDTAVKIQTPTPNFIARPKYSINTQNVVITKDGKYMFLGGHFDLSYRIFQIFTNEIRCFDRVYEHMGVVTCLSLSEDEKWLASGSEDTTIRVWKLSFTREKCVVKRGSFRIFYGHDAPIRLLALNADNGIIVSWADDEFIMINNLFMTANPFSVKVPGITKLLIEPSNCLVFALSFDSCANISIFTINGKLYITKTFNYIIKDFSVSAKALLVAKEKSLLVLKGTRFDQQDLHEIGREIDQILVFEDHKVMCITVDNNITVLDRVL